MPPPPRTGYDVTGLKKGCPGGDAAERAQHKRPGGETPRAGSPSQQVGPGNDAQLTPRSSGRAAASSASGPVDPAMLARGLIQGQPARGGRQTTPGYGSQRQGPQNPNPNSLAGIASSLGGYRATAHTLPSFDNQFIDPSLIMTPSGGEYTLNQLKAETSMIYRRDKPAPKITPIPPGVSLDGPRPAFEKPSRLQPGKKAAEYEDIPEPRKTKLPPVRACAPVSRTQQKRGVLKAPGEGTHGQAPAYGPVPAPGHAAHRNTQSGQAFARGSGYGTSQSFTASQGRRNTKGFTTTQGFGPPPAGGQAQRPNTAQRNASLPQGHTNTQTFGNTRGQQPGMNQRSSTSQGYGASLDFDAFLSPQMYQGMSAPQGYMPSYGNPGGYQQTMLQSLRGVNPYTMRGPQNSSSTDNSFGQAYSESSFIDSFAQRNPQSSFTNNPTQPTQQNAFLTFTIPFQNNYYAAMAQGQAAGPQQQQQGGYRSPEYSNLARDTKIDAEEIEKFEFEPMTGIKEEDTEMSDRGN